jgi:hypothetical protein
MQTKINQFLTLVSNPPAAVAAQLAELRNGRNPADMTADLFAVHNWLEEVAAALGGVYTDIDAALVNMGADYGKWETAVSR